MSIPLRASRPWLTLFGAAVLTTAAQLAWAPVSASQGTQGVQAGQARAQATTTIILVRHAEKAAEPAADPPLTAAGQARARALVAALRDARVTTVYSTTATRARQTAEPVAVLAGVRLTAFEPPATTKDYGGDYVKEVMSKHRGEVVVVVGHSNTIPLILRALGVPDRGAAGQAGGSMAELPYDTMLIITVPASGPARVISARYGAPG
jgi:broad specificity phosphatase PhoE